MALSAENAQTLSGKTGCGAMVWQGWTVSEVSGWGLKNGPLCRLSDAQSPEFERTTLS